MSSKVPYLHHTWGRAWGQDCIPVRVYLHSVAFLIRVLKQTLRSAGSNLTIKHVEDVSMSVLFLLEAAKKTDRAFQSSPQSIAHAVRSSQMDIVKITQHLLDQNTTSAVNNRITPQFIDPTEQGWKKLSITSWLHDILSPSQQDELDDVEKNLEEEEIDLDYELSDIV